MTEAAIISELEVLGVRLWVENAQLRYRGPAGALTDRHRDLLRAHKSGLIEWLSARDQAPVVADPANRFAPFPLTDIQAAYLVGRGDAYEFGGVGCHGYVELDLPRIEPTRMEGAWHRLIRRHEMLRAVVSRDGYQSVLAEIVPPALAVNDLRGQSETTIATAIEQTRSDLSVRCYQPDQWPLYELRLTQTDAGSVLHLSIDLLIADFVSIQVMLTELDLLYRQPDAALPPIAATFRDIVLAQRAARDGAAMAVRRERDRAYWVERIAAMPGPPELPRTESPACDGPPRFRRHQLRMSPQAWKALCGLARRWKVTPSSAVLAAFAELIGRWSRRPDFCLNVTVLNRPALHADINRVIGDFTSVNVLAVAPPSDGAFSDRAAALQARLWEDLEHAAFSGIEVLREIGRRAELRGTIMPVVFTSTIGVGDDDPAEVDGEFMTGARLSYGITQTPQVWLDCQVAERGEALHVNWDVRDGIFPDGLVDSAFAAFRALLEGLAAGPAAWEAETPIHLPAAVRAYRAGVNGTASSVPAGLLQDGFLHSARNRPDAVALVCGGAAVSYAGLAARAEAVGRALAAAGCHTESRVAVIIDKSPDQIAAVLGTLLAGGVYVPIDTAQPVARRDVILADLGIRHVLVQSCDSDKGWPAGLTIISVDRLGAAETTSVESVPAPTADSLAYIITTSGTTGRPKGVMISHRSALNTIADINHRFAVGPDDRVLGLANLSFDLSVYDIFGTFAAGGILVLPDAGRRGDPSHWADLLTANEVNIWNSVPAQMQMLTSYLESEPEARSPVLRLAMLSGDWIPVTLPAAIRAACPNARVVSLGGATEASIWSIWHDIGLVPPAARAIPYGVPLVNQSFHVLNPRLEPCPDWTVGELYIGGIGLAVGYAGDPERTAERFIHHPRSGERLYRTGDIGRYRPDGVIEFLGREDTQVKIRGHRIELSEIEAVLQTHPAVAAAIVVVGGDGLHERSLAAFVEPARRSPASDPDTAADLAATVQIAGEAATQGLDRELFAQWVDMADRIALLDILATLKKAGLFRSTDDRHDFDAVIERTRTAARHHRLLRRWMNALTGEGWVSLNPVSGLYRLVAEMPANEQQRCWQRLQTLERQVGYGTELLRYLRESADHLPELLRGETDPLDLLFPQGRLETAFAAYNDNLVNRCMNRTVCAAARALADEVRGTEPGRIFRVLEIGAGVGGTSSDLIPALAAGSVDYLFTDVSPFFLNEARERYASYPWVRFGLFDLNEDYWTQGVSAGSWDLIVCANVLHNSRNAPDVMRRLRALIAPGGALAVIEATREIHSLLTSMEFKEGLTGFTDLRRDSDQTFLTRSQWDEVFVGAGAEMVCAYPAPDDLFALAGQTAFVVRFPADRVAVRMADLQDHARVRLPDYMVPTQIEILDALPLSANGKIDRAALMRRRASQEPAVKAGGEAVRDDLEARIATIWATALGRDRIGRDDDFFVAGGDSLLIAQVVGRMRENLPEARAWEWDRLMREVLRAPTVAAVAVPLRGDGEAASGAETSAPSAASPLVGLAPPPADRDDGIVQVLIHDGSGTLTPYRALTPFLTREDGRTAGILGLTVVDGASYLKTDPDRLIETLAAEYADRLIRHGGRRFDLVGFCMGGLLALEVGRVLLEAGVEIGPVTVISSDRFRYRIDDELLLERAFGGLLGSDIAAAGHTIDNRRMEAALDHLRARSGDHFASGCLLGLGREFADVAACYARLAERPQTERLAALANAVSTRAQMVEADQAVALYQIFRHSLKAVTQYQPAPFAGDLRVLRDSETLHFLPGLRSDMRGFWSGAALGRIRFETIEGDHLSCLQPPYAEAVASRLLAGDIAA